MGWITGVAILISIAFIAKGVFLLAQVIFRLSYGAMLRPDHLARLSPGDREKLAIMLGEVDD